VGNYLLRRVLGAIPLVLGVATLIFFVLNLAPGDPAQMFANPNMPAAVIEQIRHNLGLDQPVYIRYLLWLKSFFTGHFGYSFAQGRPVLDIVLEALPGTLMLAFWSLVVVFVLGVAIGIWQAVRQYSFSDGVLSVAALFFYSMPSFWLGLMLMLLFSLKWHEWGLPFAMPATGRSTGSGR
jgi:peptide/nickel transport system permease protein